MPSTRQTTAAVPIAGSSPLVKNQMVSPAKMAPSAKRSKVESRKFPQPPLRPCKRAIMPSTTSENAKNATTTEPHHRYPSGYRTSPPRMTPAVPATVTASGDTPILRSQRAKGVKREVKKPRACLLSIRLPRPGFGHQFADLVECLRNGLGLGDDGEEVSVPTPARHNVLVQVRCDSCSTGDTLVHAQVEAAGVGNLPQHSHGCLGELGEFRRFFHRDVRVVRNMTVGADQQVARVVREKVEHHIAGPATIDDEGLLIATGGSHTERAVVLVLELVLSAFDVGHAVGSPQALKSVRNTCQAEVIGYFGVARKVSCRACVLLHRLSSVPSAFAVLDGVHDSADRLCHGHAVILAAITEAERDSTCLGVLTARDQDERDLVLAGRADLLRETV